jgi:hypothetical protein
MDIYHVCLPGQVDEAEINRMSSLQMAREEGDTAVTQFAITSDQSGLVGLMRYIHNLGYVILAVTSEQWGGAKKGGL